MITFDLDVDLPHRNNHPNFYGYVPDDDGVRGRTFFLITSISALHNLSRSLGCALLIATSKLTAFLFVGGELILYLGYKIARKDYYCFYQIEGVLAIAVCFWQRVCVKVVTDFR